MKLILATHNKHKIKEISDVISHPGVKIKSLLDHHVELPEETGDTFVANARVKAQTVFQSPLLYKEGQGEVENATSSHSPLQRGRVNVSPPFEKGGRGGIWILADDSGLCVDALNGRPGIYSSRYSGEPVDYDRNNKKLLRELMNVPKEKRTAHFICSMVLIAPDGKEYEIEGRVDGLITEKESGAEGFGYDPVFYLPSFGCTIAELPLSKKNAISHRGLAAKKALEILIEFLKANA